MPLIVESRGFIPRGRVIEGEDGWHLDRLFHSAAEVIPVAYAFLSGGRPRVFLTATGLARALIVRAEMKGWEGLDEVAAEEFFGGAGAEGVVHPVDGDREVTDLPSEEGVLPVNLRSQRVGYLVRSSRLLAEIYTDPRPYECGKGHRSADPDTGRCTYPGCISKLR